MQNQLNKDTLQKEMNQIYMEIGQIFYEDHKNEVHPVAKYADAFSRIKPIYAELEKMEKEELSAKGLRKCPSCHKHIALESKFCNMCGTKLEADKEQNEAAGVFKKRMCKTCHCELEDDAVFCANCGTRQ